MFKMVMAFTVLFSLNSFASSTMTYGTDKVLVTTPQQLNCFANGRSEDFVVQYRGETLVAVTVENDGNASTLGHALKSLISNCRYVRAKAIIEKKSIILYVGSGFMDIKD